MYNTDLEVDNDNPEAKKQISVNIMQHSMDLLSRLLDSTTDWLKLLIIICFIIIFIKNLKGKSDKAVVSVKSFAMCVDKDAEWKISKMVQELSFGK